MALAPSSSHKQFRCCLRALRTCYHGHCNDAVATKGSMRDHKQNGECSIRGPEITFASSMQEYGERLADKMLQDVVTRYQPVLQQAGFRAQCYVNTVHGHKSAANIAESLVASANDAGADMLVVTSHGGCALQRFWPKQAQQLHPPPGT